MKMLFYLTAKFLNITNLFYISLQQSMMITRNPVINRSHDMWSTYHSVQLDSFSSTIHTSGALMNILILTMLLFKPS